MTGEPRPLCPAIEPCEHGHLGTGDGRRVHWELCGNPRAGRPCSCTAVPAGGGPDHRRLFDPARWRVLLSDRLSLRVHRVSPTQRRSQERRSRRRPRW